MNFWLVFGAILITLCSLIVSPIFSELFDNRIKAKVRNNSKLSIAVLLLLIFTTAIIGVISNQSNGDSKEKEADSSNKHSDLKGSLPTPASSKLSDSSHSDQKISTTNTDSGFNKPIHEIASSEHTKIGQDSNNVVYSNDLEPQQQLIQFLEAENAIQSISDIENVLDFFSFPVKKNFKYTSVSREHLYNIYRLAYLEKYHYHKIKQYRNRIKVFSLPNERTRIEVTFLFEISQNPNGSNSKEQEVSNAYIFNREAKIESIGLATDKNL